MNTVNFKGTQQEYIPQRGDIFKSSVDELFILARVSASDKWCAISLNDGKRWADPTDIKTSINGLAFVRRNAKITVE